MEEPVIQERVSILEETLNRFILHTDKNLYRMEQGISRLQQEMKEFKDEMKDFKDDTKSYQDTVQGFVDGVKSYKDFVTEQIRSMNKQWGDLANKMGTIIEDIIAPGVRPVCAKYFKEEVYDIFTRIRRKRKDPFKQGEIDIVALSDNYAFVVEVKSYPSRYDVDKCLKNLETFKDLFPEWAAPERKPIPILGGIYFDNNDLQSYAKQKGVLLLTYREWEFLDFINFSEEMLK